MVINEVEQLNTSPSSSSPSSWLGLFGTSPPPQCPNLLPLSPSLSLSLSLPPQSLLRLLPLTLTELSTSIVPKHHHSMFTASLQSAVGRLSAGYRSAERWLSVCRALAVSRPSAGCQLEYLDVIPSASLKS
uniref:Uncharacterized protein n=1 Tax=Timema douglasi TaxID=61478 RepID=A0A7R8ZH26_TIMDO|nr:unnamed protein product [Timema douglasi]